VVDRHGVIHDASVLFAQRFSSLPYKRPKQEKPQKENLRSFLTTNLVGEFRRVDVPDFGFNFLSCLCQVFPLEGLRQQVLQHCQKLRIDFPKIMNTSAAWDCSIVPFTKPSFTQVRAGFEEFSGVRWQAMAWDDPTKSSHDSRPGANRL
jgi:hypothetical protein